MANPKETIILYDGKQIASFLAGQTATLTTKGDEVEHNIVVVAGSGGGSGGGGSGGATAIISDLHTITIEKASVKEDGNNTITIGG